MGRSGAKRRADAAVASKPDVGPDVGAVDAGGAAGPELGELRDVAVIDIGSNSVRMVIYRLDGRDFTPVLNDRAAAGLGRELASTGRLAEDGVVAALAAVRRFRLFLDARQVTEVHAVATAAVRDAEDGPAFAKKISRALGAPVRVLSGEEESRHAALGVLAGDPSAVGVVADLGGSSLELATVSDGGVGKCATFSLGAFALAERAGDDMKAVRSVLDKALGDAKIKAIEGGKLYAVGGAWRNLAKIDMQQRNYPLHLLQGYEMSAADAIDIARFLARQSPETIAGIAGVSRRRAEMMPYAAVALERVIKRFDVCAVVVSAFGLREGVLLANLPKSVRRADPLLAGADAMARRAGSDFLFGRAVEQWIAPLAVAIDPELGASRAAALISAACRLTDVGGALHPDHRGELAARRVLFAQFAGASHAERIFLARAIHHRYEGRSEAADELAMDRLLAPEAREAAVRLGLALRLAGAISGRTAPLLNETRLSLTDDQITLHVSPSGAELATEVVEKRLAQLADTMARAPKVAIDE